MSESVNYVMKNIEASHEIYKTFLDMKKLVLTRLHAAVKDSFPTWIGKGWELDQDWTLQEDFIVGVFPRDLAFKVGDDETETLRMCFELGGEEFIWKLFGLNTGNEDDEVEAHLWLTPLLKFPNGADLVKEFDKKCSAELTNRGFSRKGGKANPHYAKYIAFSNTAVLKGLENDDWEEALEPLRKSWTTLCEIIDWDDLRMQVHRSSSDQKLNVEQL